MPSMMRKNTMAGSLSRSIETLALEIWMPPEDIDGICTAQAIAANTALLIDGAMMRPFTVNGRSALEHPACPTFTFSDTTSRCEIQVKGLNYWQEPIVFTVTKELAGTVLKTLNSAATIGRIPAMTRIDEIRITQATVAAGTVAVGFNYSSGNTNTIPLPCRFKDVASLTSPTNTRTIYMDEWGGFWNGATFPGFLTIPTSMTEYDARNGVVPVTTGVTTQAITALSLTNGRFTAATWTAGTFTLSLTGAFHSYVFAPGDTVTIVSGTGATAGKYVVASRVDNDSITLVTSPGVDAADYVFSIDKVILGKASPATTFANYTPQPGDTISITGGTGAIVGNWPVVRKDAANSLILAGDPGIGGLAPVAAGDLTATLSSSPTKWGHGFLLVDPDLLYLQ